MMMSAVRLICIQNRFLTYMYLLPEYKGKCKLSNNSIMSYTMVLYIESTFDQYGLGLSKMEPLLC